MVFEVKKVDKKTYQVRNKFSGVVRATRSSYRDAQEVANDLNRSQRVEGAEFARVRSAAQ
jgi:hypothetical protein